MSDTASLPVAESWPWSRKITDMKKDHPSVGRNHNNSMSSECYISMRQYKKNQPTSSQSFKTFQKEILPQNQLFQYFISKNHTEMS